ncbi:zinc finger protein Helios isoform X3 [Osmerus mordax]|uniref:zinc finger protein Helios isoform X3 n=1 Tax=Osmerus mordax TaxID=8014 RepID=UPI00350F4987
MQPIRIIIVNGNGDCPPRKENSRMSVDLSANTPNGQEPQGPKSPSEVTIKQEEGTGDEADGKSTAPEDMTHSGEEGSGLEEPMIDSPNNLQDGVSGSDGVSDADNRLQNGDRPFQCNQCGVSFTQKGNLLRHIKLHTGEKPFKCPFCSYACRRRDALSGHLRTHSGEATKEHRPPAEASVMATFDRPPVIERLQSNVGKRKSSNPQKFVGEKMVRYSYPELNYEMGMKYEKEAEMMQAHMMDQAINNAISYLGADSIRPLVHHPRPHPHPGTPLSMAEVVPMVNPLFSHVYSTMGPRMERPSSRDVPHIPVPLPPPDYPPSSNGPVSLSRPKHPPAVRGESPSNSGLDSADSARSSPQERLGYHANLPHPRSRPSPVYGREERRAAEAGLTPEVLRGGGERPVSQDGVRVIGRQGQEVRVFQCEHCRILFLDHVMYTIHMGCHGYRDPLECNICGHRSKDHYEFSSHIVRGEHTFR